MCRCLGASTPLYGHVMVPVLFITGISIFRSLLTAMQMCLRLFSKYLLPCTHATLSISWDACPGRCSPCPPLPVPALIVPCRALTLGSIPRRRKIKHLLWSSKKHQLKTGTYVHVKKECVNRGKKKRLGQGVYLGIQWLRICLAMQET